MKTETNQKPLLISKKSGKSQFITIAVCIMLFSLPLGKGRGWAQNVGISATGINPDNSAMLDVTSNTKGMLIPRMTGTDKYNIPSPATGLLIFQTDTVGFWYYDGTKWIPLVSSTSSTASPSNAGWLTTGNIGTAWNKHFLGTTDNVSLRLRTNDTTRMLIEASGNVGIGTTIPYTKLDIRGPSGVTSFTGTSVLGVNIGGSASTNDYVGIDFRNTAGGSYPQARIGSYQSGSGSYLQFGTSNNYGLGITNTAMTIDHRGYVGIGTTNPGYPLEVTSGTSAIQIRSTTTNSNASLYFYGQGGTTYQREIVLDPVNDKLNFRRLGVNHITIDGNGYVGIGTTAPSEKLEVCGNLKVIGNIRASSTISASQAITCSSDIRYKKDITPLSHALDKVLSMQGVNYHWKTDTELRTAGITSLSFGEGRGEANQIGFIAQELEKIIPEVVMTDKDGYKSVDYSRLTPVLVEAIKEQQKTIENAELRIKNAELEITELKAAVNKLTQQTTTAEAKK